MSDYSSNLSRRAFLQGSGAAAAASAWAGQAAAQGEAQPAADQVVRGLTKITLHVNGEDRGVEVEPRDTLLEVLRRQLQLTGAKPVSLEGVSGASTVLVDGKPMSASTLLAVSLTGRQIVTVEGLAQDAVPAAFVQHDAQQCGFCTPGFVVAVRAFLNAHPKATEAEIRAGLNGNICRCGTYANVLQAAISIAQGGRNA